jgi:hypothetical protein
VKAEGVPNTNQSFACNGRIDLGKPNGFQGW